MHKDRINVWSRILIFATLGIIVGIVILHPAAMFIRDYHGWARHLDWSALRMAFSLPHAPMSIFFGTLGAFIGALYGVLDVKLTRHARKIELLEGMLPICCVCKRIRNENPQGNRYPEWVQIEEYISNKSDATFTHGYCPDCQENVMKEIEQLTQLKSGAGQDTTSGSDESNAHKI